jgi:AcrR family transcriptional regulator
MAKASSRSPFNEARRLPRGRHALAPEEVLADQRQRLLAAVPGAVAEHGYEALTVADVVRRAGVSRNAFYKNFSGKQECFAVAHEACHERLLEILSQPCDKGASVEERVERALGATLDVLAKEPDVARLLFVEAPSAGAEIALRYHEWLQRYGALLRAAIPQAASKTLAVEIDEVIVGGIATRIASEVLREQAIKLRVLTPQLVDYVLAFYGAGQPDPHAAGVVTFEPPKRSPGNAEARRKQAGA